MAYIGVQVRIRASKEQVWQVLSNLAGVQNYSAFVSKSYYTSDSQQGIGCSRICELPGMTVEETAIDWQREHYYRLRMETLKGTNPPVDNLVFTMRMEQDGQHIIVWNEATYDTKFGIVGILLNQLVLKRQFRKTMARVLDGLKYHIETGSVLVNTDALKQVPAIAVSA